MENKKKKIWKIVGIVAVVLCIVVCVSGYFIGHYFFNLALNPKADRTVVFSAENNQLGDGYDEEVAILQQQWFEGIKPNDIYQTSYDDLKLHAYEIKQPTKTEKWVVIAHGYSGQANQMIASAQRFYEMGYNIVLPDARGHGESEGDYIGMGWHERKDMTQWIEGITKDDANSQIILYGVSMGGATVMMTSGENLPTNVKAIVEDCGYTSVFDEFSYQLKSIFGIGSFPVMNFADIVTKMKAGYGLKEASALEQVKKSKTPMLFIHGDQDTFVPSEMVHEVYESANVEKQLLVVEGAGHGAAADIAGENYWNTVKGFVNKYLN